MTQETKLTPHPTLREAFDEYFNGYPGPSVDGTINAANLISDWWISKFNTTLDTLAAELGEEEKEENWRKLEQGLAEAHDNGNFNDGIARAKEIILNGKLK